MDETYEKKCVFPYPLACIRNQRSKAEGTWRCPEAWGNHVAVTIFMWKISGLICFFGDFQKMMIVPREICRDFQIEENTYVIAMKSTNGYPKGYFMGDITNGMLIWVCPEKGETLHVASFYLGKR